MRDDNDGDSEAIVELPDQRVDAACGDRIEIGSRFVEKKNLRVERERPRESGALHHAAGKRGGKLDAGFCRQTGKRQFHRRDLFLLLGR